MSGERAVMSLMRWAGGGLLGCWRGRVSTEFRSSGMSVIAIAGCGPAVDTLQVLRGGIWATEHARYDLFYGSKKIWVTNFMWHHNHQHLTYLQVPDSQYQSHLLYILLLAINE